MAFTFMMISIATMNIDWSGVVRLQEKNDPVVMSLEYYFDILLAVLLNIGRWVAQKL